MVSSLFSLRQRVKIQKHPYFLVLLDKEKEAKEIDREYQKRNSGRGLKNLNEKKLAKHYRLWPFRQSPLPPF
ncbi:MAG: hypothetical protein COT34_02650 [Candidatus Nealsonbacteria bacterium CG08_land_8_20_14_0_20_43_11]|uniref:Uncharacterized protein n=1 Tax=Candidatus Nealsonbacteria bacterium CG08_land_8_20_14_0_20_43_11 TaxID=1974706 RepID=A0A2M6SZY9_9BACT|nr:MAG: hypothetical protein COT34_02650 [Candidatus Nealsonbacteria bacterium CG08_land_8_20_14_0_20_43_11]